MNKSLPKQHQLVSAQNNLDEPEQKKRKLRDDHQNLSSCPNNKHYVQLCKKNTAKKFQNEILSTFNGFDELGK